VLVIPDPKRARYILQDLSPAETRVLAALMLFPTEIDDQPMVVTLGQIMAASGLSKPTVNQCTHSLTRAGALNVWGRGKGPGATMKIRINPALIGDMHVNAENLWEFMREFLTQRKQFRSERAALRRKDKL
jgi:DNA-binding IclR family transcriptional regulator